MPNRPISTSHLIRPITTAPCRGATSEVSARIPPSPLLSARSTYSRYLTDTMMISAQITSDSAPMTLSLGHGKALAGEGLAEGVQRTRADVAVDDAQRAQGEQAQAGLRVGLTAHCCLGDRAGRAPAGLLGQARSQRRDARPAGSEDASPERLLRRVRGSDRGTDRPRHSVGSLPPRDPHQDAPRRCRCWRCSRWSAAPVPTAQPPPRSDRSRAPPTGRPPRTVTGRSPGRRAPTTSLRWRDWTAAASRFLSTPPTRMAPRSSSPSPDRATTGSPEERIGSLVLNPGGPGGSGIEFLANAAAAFPESLTDRFDLVSFDPRGVAESTPVRLPRRRDQGRAAERGPLPRHARRGGAGDRGPAGVPGGLRVQLRRAAAPHEHRRRGGRSGRVAPGAGRRAADLSGVLLRHRRSARSTQRCSPTAAGRWCSTAR